MLELPPPPPQAESNSINANGSARIYFKTEQRRVEEYLRAEAGRITDPISATAQSHSEEWNCIGMRADEVRDVVVRVTTNDEVEVALTIKLAGTTEQAAPLGAPAQVSAACPLHPAPPIDKLYVVEEPAKTVAVFELALRPKPVAVPERDTA